jgi:hypothetical protein
MCPFSKTMVWIEVHPRLRKAREPSIPAMQGHHRSHDLDGASKWTTEIYLQQFRSASPKSTAGVISEFWTSKFSNLKLFLSSVMKDLLHCDPTTIFSLSPELMISFELEDFVDI